MVQSSVLIVGDLLNAGIGYSFVETLGECGFVVNVAIGTIIGINLHHLLLESVVPSNALQANGNING